MATITRNAATLRRLNVLHRILSTGNDSRPKIQRLLVRSLSVDGKVTIDGISKAIKIPDDKQLVPQKFRKCPFACVDII